MISTKGYITQRYWLWIPPSTALFLLLVLFFTGCNNDVFYFINGLNTFTGPDFWAHVTILGDTLVLAVLILPWIRRRPDLVWAFVAAGIFAFIVSHGVKHFVHLQRPSIILDRSTFVLTGPPHRSYAYPSGHATSAYMTAAIFILSIRLHWVKALLMIFATVISISRIAVGIHWPVDILGGLMAGWGSAWIGLWAIRRYRWAIKERGCHILSILFILGAVILTLFHHTGYPQTEIFQRIIGITMLIWGMWEYHRRYGFRDLFRKLNISSG
jgi:membrane-associated phospholipid phosphatase